MFRLLTAIPIVLLLAVDVLGAEPEKAEPNPEEKPPFPSLQIVIKAIVAKHPHDSFRIWRPREVQHINSWLAERLKDRKIEVIGHYVSQKGQLDRITVELRLPDFWHKNVRYTNLTAQASFAAEKWAKILAKLRPGELARGVKGQALIGAGSAGVINTRPFLGTKVKLRGVIEAGRLQHVGTDPKDARRRVAGFLLKLENCEILAATNKP
jgi:hypothetical protein